MNKKKIFRWTKILLVIYVIIGFGIYWLQDYFIFRGVKIPADQPYQFTVPFKEINIPFNASTNINIVQFSCSNPAKGLVLYFHGNRTNIGRYTRFAPDFTNNGYEVWMIDYPGYGKSTGKLTEQSLYDFALQFYKLGRARFGKDSIIIYGKSLGTGIASWLAAKRECKALILETPYYSLNSLAERYFPIYPIDQIIRYKIPSYEYLREVQAPISIFHGTADWVITYSNAQRLKPSLKQTDEFITIEGGGHHNLNEYPLFHHKLDSLLQLK
jgi:hypothetical protein